MAIHRRLSRFHNGLVGLRSAFTMAEILLSLTIIGVVAAITLPSLTGNINERTWNTQRKALYARFSQAIALMPALNGYGTLTGGFSDDGTQYITEDNVAETFITNGLAKVLKINNICSDNLADCGIVSSITNAQATKIDTPVKLSELYAPNTAGYQNSFKLLDTKAAAFETANGESVLVYYNPHCSGSDVMHTNGGQNVLPVSEKVCVNFVYDLNGSKGPNTFGKDLGIITALYPTDSVVVAPLPYLRGGDISVAWAQAASSCKNIDSEYRAPNREEMMALMYNYNLVNLRQNKYWTTTRAGSDKAWVVSLTGLAWTLDVGATDNREPMSVHCVKR